MARSSQTNVRATNYPQRGEGQTAYDLRRGRVARTIVDRGNRESRYFLRLMRRQEQRFQGAGGSATREFNRQRRQTRAVARLVMRERRDCRLCSLVVFREWSCGVCLGGDGRAAGWRDAGVVVPVPRRPC